VAGQRKALIIANAAYEHQALRNLRAPAADAEALGRVLSDPRIGGFDVEVLHDEPAYLIQARVENLLTSARPEDVLLLHFSCHGLKDESGELFFAASNTFPEMLGSTTVPAEFVQRYMLRSRSRDVVLLLDCCYGGAFPAGATVRAAGDANVLDSFPQERPETGRSRVVITATTSMQFALEGNQLVDDERARPSVFTAALVQGLATGDADLDEDGWISVRELYDYVLDKVRAQNPNQTPTIRGDLAGRLYLARSRRRRVRPAPIPAGLQSAMAGDGFARLGALSALRSLLTGDDVPEAAGAYEALAKLADDDSRKVANSAREALKDAAIRPAQLEVDFGRVAQKSVPPHQTVQLLGPPIARACAPHASHDWIRADHEADADELDISVDTSGIGARHGSITLKGPSGEAVIAIAVELFPPSAKRPVRVARKAWAAAAVAVLLAIGGLIWIVFPGGSAGAYSSSNYSGGSYGFNKPGAIADDDADVWVANTSGQSVTELGASSGNVVKVFSGGSYGFSDPGAIADDGADVWVANLADNSVTELNASNGDLVKVLSNGSYGFSGPGAIAAYGGYVWVANSTGDSVTELSASNGDLVKVFSNGSYGFSDPEAIADDGTDVWVANADGDSVTELNADNGGRAQVILGGNYQFNTPDAIASDGTHVWVANRGDNSVTELYASNGELAKAISDGNYQLSAPSAIASDGTHVWVANADDNSVTELNADDGSLAQVISGGRYQFGGPQAIAEHGSDVWVANNTGNSVTKLYPG
jgi:hypothetical protein